MSFLKTNHNGSLNLARPEPVRAPGRRELAARLAAVWLVLAGALLLLGLVWRVTGLAPDLGVALDGCSLALWAAALAIAPAFNNLLVRRVRHGRHGLRWSLRHAGDTAMLWLGAVLVALAPVGLLPAYNSRGLLPYLNAYSSNIPLPGWAWFTGVLLLMGPALVLASTALLHLLRRLAGADRGTAVWLLAGLLVHRHLLAGQVVPLEPASGWPPVLSGGGLADPASLAWPLSLGDFARWWALYTAQSHSDSVFLGEYLLVLLRNPAVLTAIALVLLNVLPRPHAHSTARLPVGWLAAVGVTGAAVLHCLLVGFLWVSDASLIFPGDWPDYFSLAVTTAWAVWLAVELSRPGRTPWLRLRDLAWCWLALGAAALLTIPNLAADQLYHADLVPYLGAALVVLTLGLLTINLAARLAGRGRPGQGVALLVLLAVVLVLPFPAGGGVLPPAVQAIGLLARSALDPALRYYAWGGSALALALCAAAWPRRPRRLTTAE